MVELNGFKPESEPPELNSTTAVGQSPQGWQTGVEKESGGLKSQQLWG